MIPRRSLRAGLDRHAPAIRALLCLILLVAMLGRGLIAPGFMPVLNAQKGEIAVEMCSGMGAMQMLPVSAPEEQHHKQADSERCPFAALSSPVLPAPVMAIAPPVVVVLAQAPRHAGQPSAPYRALRSHAPPTGPPLLA